MKANYNFSFTNKLEIFVSRVVAINPHAFTNVVAYQYGVYFRTKDIPID
jgi:hypothetical protein